MITYHWSRTRGKVLNKNTGEAVELAKPMNEFFSKMSQSDWDQTLIETIIDVQNKLGVSEHFKVFASKHVCDIMMNSVLSKPVKEEKQNKNTVGQIGQRFTIYRDDSLGDVISVVSSDGKKGFVKVHP